MEASTPALVAQSLNHWTTRQVPTLLLLNSSLQGLTCPSPVVLFPAPPWRSWFWGFCWLNYLIYVLILLFLVQILIRYLTKYALCVCVCSVAQSSLTCVWLCATPQTVACHAPLSMGFFPTRILEWVAISSSRQSFQPRDQTRVSCISWIGRQILNQ